MHVLFIHSNINIKSPKLSFAVAVLSAFIKQRGHTASLLLASDYLDLAGIKERVTTENPDLIAITTNTSQWYYAEKIAEVIKKSRGIPIICGGIHPTLCPEQVVSSPWIDAICIGEGEYPLIEFLESLEGKRGIEMIPNTWVKIKRRWRKERIFKNHIRSAIQNLDEIPLFDLEIFGPEKFMQRNNYGFLGKPGFFPFMTGRGCPYRCTFCCNSSLLELYKGDKVPFVRKHSFDYIFQGMRTFCNKYNVKGFEIFDEMLGPNEKWIIEFCKRYASEISLPYVTPLRVELATPHVIQYLKDSGCFMLAMGIESGNEAYRKTYLNRKMSNQQIIDAFQEAKKSGIKTLSWNMIGLPFETADMIRETIELNRKIRPDIIGVAVYEPLPKTPLRDLCEKEGLLTKRQVYIYSDISVLDQKTLSQKELSECYQEFISLAKEVGTEKMEWT